MMYGRKSEIQRIQAKLQRIGKANPYRPNLNEVPRNEMPRNEMPRNEMPRNEVSNEVPREASEDEIYKVETSPDQSRNLEQISNPSVNNEGTGTSLQQPLTKVEPFLSTHDRYHTPAGQQALKEMGKVARLPDPLPEAVTFSPQSPWTSYSWPSQISIVDSEASKNSHQLAHSLRQQSYVSDSGGYGRGYANPAPDSAQVPPLMGTYGNSRLPDRGAGNWLPGHIASWGTHSRFSLTQGLMWLVGAVVIRMGIDRLLGAFPSLWVVMAAMVLTPVAIVLYQTAVNPQATVHSGRRLLVIMMGLLIGGQL